MPEKFFIKELPNGLTLLGQQMDGVSSASLAILVTAGAAYDPPSAEGAAAVASEWLMRGAGNRNSRQLNDLLDSLGCQHDESVQSEHVILTTAQLGRNLDQVLPIYADILRRPAFDDATFEPCRQLIMQDLASLEDEPARKCNMLLREKFYPYPLGRCPYGHEESLDILRPKDVREHMAACVGPRDAIIAIAGSFDWDRFVDLADRHFGDWQSPEIPPVHTIAMPTGETHIKKDTAQTHIALAYPSVILSHPDYYKARLAETVLSGGMSSRLFTEVREKRGLVYGVACRYHSLKTHAGFFVYAGTRPEVAQQTFEVTIGELRRLADGVTDEEIARARTQLKASLIMQGESTPARAGAIASDWYHLRRLRSLSELNDAIDGVTIPDVLDYARQYPPDRLTVLVIGPEPLKLPSSK